MMGRGLDSAAPAEPRAGQLSGASGPKLDLTKFRLGHIKFLCPVCRQEVVFLPHSVFGFPGQ